MPAITVRHVPEHVRDELAARASRSGRSLQEYVAALLAEAVARPTPEDVIVAARRRVSAAGSVLGRETILAARDADRR